MKDKLIEVKQEGDRITVNVSDRILFASGSAEVKPSGEAALQKIADEVEWAIRHEPHQWFCFRQLWPDREPSA